MEMDEHDRLRRRRRKKKKKKANEHIDYEEIDLNIMPFIDVFSLLNTFLLMTAVFLQIGILKVQIPFLTNNPPEDDKPQRTLQVAVDMSKERVQVTTSYSAPPRNEKDEEFPTTDRGLERLHQYMVSVRRDNPETDKVKFYSDDDVIWKDMSHVLDAVKLRQPNDPVFPVDESKPDEVQAQLKNFLFPKVVMASVML